MSNDAEEAGSAARNSCPLCGSDKFTWGLVRGERRLRFKSDDAGWLAKNIAIGGLEIKAKKCASCGNIQLFAVE
jgi:ribosomal protein S27AE